MREALLLVSSNRSRSSKFLAENENGDVERGKGRE